MSQSITIILGIVGALALVLVGWLFWSVEKANRKNPRAKTNTLGGAPFWGGSSGDSPDGGGGASGGDGGGG